MRGPLDVWIAAFGLIRRGLKAHKRKEKPMTELLLHSLRLYEPDLEVIRAAYTTWKELHYPRTISGGAVPGSPFFDAIMTGTTAGRVTPFVLPESDLVIIANGLVLISEHPEFKFHEPQYTQFEAVYDRIQKHLGKAFMY